MRYKELSLRKIDEVKNLIKTLEFNTSRNVPFFETQQSIEQIKNKINELESMINIERDDYNTDSNFII